MSLMSADTSIGMVFPRFESVHADVVDELVTFPGNAKLEKLKVYVELAALTCWTINLEIRAFRNLNEAQTLDPPDFPTVTPVATPH